MPPVAVPERASRMLQKSCYLELQLLQHRTLQHCMANVPL